MITSLSGRRWPKVAQLLGFTTPRSVRTSVRQAEVDRRGVTTEESVELRRLKREAAEPCRAKNVALVASLLARRPSRTRRVHPRDRLLPSPPSSHTTESPDYPGRFREGIGCRT